MARTVDPARHEARRVAIIDAALTCFAAEGFDRATTAAICRRAAIGSGTFFHYFPTKLGVLLAILDHGTAETVEWFAARDPRADPSAVVTGYVEHAADELADPRVAGFVRAVGAVMTDPDVAAALARDEDAVHAGLQPWLAAAQGAGQVRADIPADRLATWVMLLLDGFTGRLAGERQFDPATERALLADTVRRLLAP
jgi:AcrR family transcriptional regulator